METDLHAAPATALVRAALQVLTSEEEVNADG